ncbi:MAG: SdrD B-like domain-containing protein [Oscillibacter sp.]|nr:leucine-rich repeat domain-containing protein [Oscillibacter sp.]MEA4992477.1 SdrD B-like domain-containing protein [Oscillibacter sp.]
MSVIRKRSGLLRITSFLLIAVLLLEIWPVSAATASATDAEAGSAVISENEPGAAEGEVPTEDETPAEGEAPDEVENPKMEGNPATPTDLPGIYENSISGLLWLDVLDDPDSGVHSGDGIRQPEEAPLPGYGVSLYLAEDRENAVQTVATDGNGAYRFENMEPGSYVVGISSTTIDDVEYLLPIAGVTGDNKFSDFSDDYTTVYSVPIEAEEDSASFGVNAGMRTLPKKQAAALGDYNINDVEAINGIILNNGLTGYSLDAPDTWDFVTWHNVKPAKRVIQIDVRNKDLTGTLNLSGRCPMLKTLYCDNNRLTGLNVTDLTKLQTLYCENNQISSLNVSSCTSLQDFRCSNNQLTSLDASGLTYLAFLFCQNNQISSLSLNHDIAFLRILHCENNQLTSLNLNGFTSLVTSGCSGNPRIQELVVPNGDTICLQSNTGGRVEFVNYIVTKNNQLSIKAVPNEGYVFERWEATPAVTYNIGLATSESVTVTAAAGTTTITPQFLPQHTVTVRYVDKNGSVIVGAANGTDYTLSNATTAFTISLPAVNAYQAVYYTVDGGGRQDIDLSDASSYTVSVTSNTTITVYYASTILTISYPLSGMAFYALHTDNGAVTSADYEFENLSDLPVQVSFKGMNVINNAGVNFVSNAVNRNEIHLSLLASSGSNGFASNLNNIIPNTSYGSPHQFGTLDGALVGTVGTTKGYLSIGGYYNGPFTLTPKLPEVEFTFHFLLVQ